MFVCLCVCVDSLKITINFDCPFPVKPLPFLTPDLEKFRKISGKDVQTPTIMCLQQGHRDCRQDEVCFHCLNIASEVYAEMPKGLQDIHVLMIMTKDLRVTHGFP